MSFFKIELPFVKIDLHMSVFFSNFVSSIEKHVLLYILQIIRESINICEFTNLFNIVILLVMKAIIRAVEFNLIYDTVTLFVQCRLVEVSGDFYRYMKHNLCVWNSGLRQVAPLVWYFNSDNACRLEGNGMASFLSHVLQLR